MDRSGHCVADLGNGDSRGGFKHGPVDVEAVLTRLASARGKPNNWRQSIVDLPVPLDLDSSLSARKELAAKLNIHAGDHSSAEQNITLHKAVMKKLAENGGKVPAERRD